MQKIFPNVEADELDDDALAAAYGVPAETPFWLRVNFVSSVDGAVTLDGRSAKLSSAGDKRLFGLLRDLSDVILVGAHTTLVEGYDAVPPSPRRQERRAAFGRAPAPRIAVVSGRLVDLDPAGPLFTTAPPEGRTIVITHAASPEDRRRELAAVADVLVAGDDQVDLAQAVRQLRQLGVTRVNCEGGPRLLRDTIAAGIVDEFCLTLAPVLVGPRSAQVPAGLVTGPPLDAARWLRLEQTLTEEGYLFLRYLFGVR